MENEMVLVYAVEKTKELKKTSLKHEDRILQKITASGKSCSGKVTKFAKIAVPGSYNQDGTIKQ
jgi:sorbitol-specific phosphotransferase system component IIA